MACREILVSLCHIHPLTVLALRASFSSTHQYTIPSQLYIHTTFKLNYVRPIWTLFSYPLFYQLLLLHSAKCSCFKLHFNILTSKWEGLGGIQVLKGPGYTLLHASVLPTPEETKSHELYTSTLRRKRTNSLTVLLPYFFPNSPNFRLRMLKPNAF